PVSRPSGRGSWYKNQAHVLIFMILNFICSLNQVFLQSDRQELWFLPVFSAYQLFCKNLQRGDGFVQTQAKPQIPVILFKGARQPAKGWRTGFRTN
ncbi:hypothetical protein, partial [Angelakisella massiliensis]|uniref:hypothetical protein n=1 Tax=Angelakisella massiliensis TaxID=1871018 RepID=UPI0024B11468